MGRRRVDWKLLEPRPERRDAPAAASPYGLAQLLQRAKIANRGHELHRGCVTAVFKLIEDKVVNDRPLPPCRLPSSIEIAMAGSLGLIRTARPSGQPRGARGQLEQPHHRAHSDADAEQDDEEHSDQRSHRSSWLNETGADAATRHTSKRSSGSSLARAAYRKPASTLLKAVERVPHRHPKQITLHLP